MLLQGSIIDSTHDHDSPWPFCRVHGRGGLQRPGQCEDWMIDQLMESVLLGRNSTAPSVLFWGIEPPASKAQ